MGGLPEPQKACRGSSGRKGNGLQGVNTDEREGEKTMLMEKAVSTISDDLTAEKIRVLFDWLVRRGLEGSRRVWLNEKEGDI